jgi:hypothetical protein
MKSMLSLVLMSCLIACGMPGRVIGQHYSWKQSDSTCALLDGTQVVWQLNFSKSQDKPFFHPLRVLGSDVTMERPADHGHHRGLWFAWRDINKVNYWEEVGHTGVSEGRSKITKVDAKLAADFSAKIVIDLAYGPEGKAPILNEHRTLSISRPDASGSYYIDWEMNFKARSVPLLFDCVPTLKRNGVAYGGYAGLGYRGAGSLVNPVFTASNGWTNDKDLTGYGQGADWMDMTAGMDNSGSKQGGITLFDHPKNSRYPSPWYIWYAAGKHTFFMPAILYNEPLELAAGKKMALKYRVFVHSGKPDKKQLDGIFKAFSDR